MKNKFLLFLLLFLLSIVQIPNTSHAQDVTQSTNQFGFKSISTGSHVAGLKEDGTVVAWGWNKYGQCNVPKGLTNVKKVSVGGDFTVALKEDGTVVVWGSNEYGQCDVPIGLVNVKDIAVGWKHIVALKEDGTVVAWGRNEYNECNIPIGLVNVKFITDQVALKKDGTVVVWGDNTYGQCNIPEGLTNVKSIAAGGGAIVALKEDGTVVAWGFSYSAPQGLTNVKSIAVVSGATLAFKEDGTVVAWGNNTGGLCDSLNKLTNVKAVSSGRSHIVVLKEDGTVAAFGENNYFYRQCDVPEGLTKVKSIHAYSDYTIALKEDGKIVGWGDNFDGVFEAPTESKIISIAQGDSHIVALKEDGTVSVWGSNIDRQCNIPRGLTNIKAIAAGHKYSVALKEDGTIVAWGNYDSGECYVPEGIKNIKAVALGNNQTVALKEDGTLIDWGFTRYGLHGLTNIKAIAAGSYHTVALKEDGTVIAWGDNRYGQCNIPYGLTNVKAIYAGELCSVALKEDGTVVAWGDNTYGQCNVPQGLTNIKQVAVGSSHMIALKNDGTAVCWGYIENDYCIPNGFANIKAISTAYDRSAILKEDGTVVGFGHVFLIPPSFPSSKPTSTPVVTTTPIPTQTSTPMSLSPKGCLDNPKENSTINGICSLYGWYLDMSGVSKIEVLVDGNVVCAAVYGDPRADVKNAYPAFNNSNSGYHYYLDTTKFTNGTHTILIREFGNNGKTNLLPPRTIQISNPKGCLDFPKENSTIIGPWSLYGWYLDMSGVSKIEVLVDGNVVGTAEYGDLRDDVKNAYPAFNTSYSGYHYYLDTTKFSDGTHTIAIRELGNNGKTNLLPPRTVQVSNPKGYLDNPKENSTISGICSLYGWYLDTSGVSKIQVMIDGKVVGSAVYGDPRADVKNAYPAFNNSFSGYHYYLDTTKFTNGTHNILICEFGNNGKLSILPRTVQISNVAK